jgi:hypothetical protein
MKNFFQNTTSLLNRGGLIAISLLLATASLQFTVFNSSASAALITSRTLTLSTSSAAAGAATTTYTLTFTLPSATVLQSFDIEVCETASDTCTTPTGFDSTSSTIDQPTNLGDPTGWTVDAATAGKLRLTNGSNVAAPSSSQTVVFNNVQNPTTANESFFGRMTSYSDDSYTTAIDSGVVAASTTEDISLTGTVDETLVFQTGTSGTCGALTGASVDFGTFSSALTSTGTSLMCASTNGVTGYAITINGSTLTCLTCASTPTIAALASQAASAVDTAQYGINLKNNATPVIGAEVIGGGSALATVNYATADQYRFVSGDSVSAVAEATDSNLFTVSYIVNIPGAQPAGIYTSTMTFIATATF